MVGPRINPIPEFTKELKSNKNKREFNHSASVFKNWKREGKTEISKALQHDFTYWKVPRFIKEEGDITTIKEYIRENWDMLNQIFLTTAAHGNFPTLSWLDFEKFVRKANLMDKNITEYDVS